MANNYRKKNAPARRGFAGQLLLVGVFFIAGYFSASLCDLTHLSAWLSSTLLAKNTQKTPVQGVAVAELPKPKFEFYTLLANERVAGVAQSSTQGSSLPVAVLPVKESSITEPVAPTTTLATTRAVAPVNSVKKSDTPINPVIATNKAPIASVNTSKDAYLVQVGSFRSLREAERMKIGLVMKGLDVKIATINQQNTNWFRVFIGPFSSHTQAQLAQQDFAKKEHVMGMIRRMDA